MIIIGAGLAGLTAARNLLESGVMSADDILIVDDGPTVGGRLATTTLGPAALGPATLGPATLDHGAQFFTVRSEAFRADVDRWLAAGAVEEWCQGFSEVDGYPRYRGTGGMKNLAAHLAAELTSAGVEIRTNTPVTKIEREGSVAWKVSYHQTDGAASHTQTQAVIATAPVPITTRLLTAGSTEIAEEHQPLLQTFAYHQVLALLTVLDRSPSLPEPGALQQPNDPTFSFVADNQAKSISDVPAVTFHTAHALSAELWSSSDAAAEARLLPAAATLVAPAEIIEHRLVRWPYTGPVTPYPEACAVIANDPGPLILAGDGFGTSKVEGAYLSGRAAAETLAAIV